MNNSGAAETGDMTSGLLTTRWSSQRDEDRFIVENPADGSTLAVVQGAGAEEVDKAVRAAQSGFESWRSRPAAERGGYLTRAAQVLREHADELAALESAENGKPVTQARSFDIEAAIGIFELFGRLVCDQTGESRDRGPVLDVTELHPYGVVGAIIPFNWPPIHTAGKSAPALAVGNAVVLKPGEQAPLTSMRMIELIREVLPDDVLHIVPGTAAAGAALATHPLVRKLSFTGAPATGAAVSRSAAGNLTPLVMELGGKNPLVIFEDADLDAAVGWAVEGGFFNQGEACTAASRVLVHRSVHDDVAGRLAAAVSRLVVGDGARRETQVGPLVTRAQMSRVLDYITIGVDEGAAIAAQAELPDDPKLASGFYVRPTLFTAVRPDMRIAQEEIFGPVVVVIPFDDEEDAVRIANGTDFGLVAGVFTRDISRGVRVSRRLEAGLVFLNHYNRAALGAPFGGTKHSGYGREHTAETLKEFGYTKTLRLPLGDGEIPQWDAVSQVYP